MGLTTLKMPRLGESVTEGTVDRWLKQEGELVRRDEPIVEVVTDKVNAEIPSPVEGRLVRIQVQNGETVPIGTALAELEVEGATVPSVEAPAADAAQASQQKAPDAGRVSPGVRKLLEDNGLDIRDIPGTGPDGRVRREDVVAHLAARGAPGRADELVRISAVRRQIAEHMVRSVSTSPHAWAMREVDASSLSAYREAEKDSFRERNGFALSYVPFFVQIVCDALLDNPYLNSTWTEDGIVLHHYVHMGIAVALPDSLIVPVVKDADMLSFMDLAREINDLANRARSKSLRPDDVRGGTFTLNNTGALGSHAGQSIINQPQAAILSTESIRKRPVVVGDAVVVRPIMNVTMSFDHRIVDGLAAGRFLSAVQAGIEGWTPEKIRL
ncbi:MAG TPA: dihydrolipoamide acetyltransferase family protein [Candidatus Dormibacteraeota bacterium]|nr:dihydrolipoamide acetyltransferase family protein [Candidatus Dormibacteraeota bacterium]